MVIYINFHRLYIHIFSLWRYFSTLEKENPYIYMEACSVVFFTCFSNVKFIYIYVHVWKYQHVLSILFSERVGERKQAKVKVRFSEKNRIDVGITKEKPWPNHLVVERAPWLLSFFLSFPEKIFLVLNSKSYFWQAHYFFLLFLPLHFQTKKIGSFRTPFWQLQYIILSLRLHSQGKE